MKYSEAGLTKELDLKIIKLKQELSAAKKEKEEKLIEYRKSIFTVGKKLKLYKYGYGEDYTYIEGTIESVHKDYFCLDATDSNDIYRVGSINMLNYSSFPDYYDSVEIIEDNNE